MTNFARLEEPSKLVGQEITLLGWVFNIRSSGKILFLQFRDGLIWLQAVVTKDQIDPKVWEAAQSLTIESSIELSGTIREEKRSPFGYEMDVKTLRVFQIAQEYPIGKKEHGPDFLLDNRHLWLRARSQWAVLRLRHFIKIALQEYFNTNGYVQLDTPIFTPNACEGTSDLFEVNYFDRPAYLSQNGQLYLEAMCLAFGKVYDLSPNFRAEKSKTRKHLTEFWTLNPEIAFINHEESLQIQEECLKHVVDFVLKNARQEMDILERDTAPLEQFLQKPFIHFTYTGAIKELQRMGSDIKYGEDLGADDEVLLTKDSDAAVIVKEWPKSIKPFYMKQHAENPALVYNADVLAPRGFGEIIGGSQREDDYDILLANIKAAGLPIKIFEWYLDLRRYGSVPHAGFGIGIERLTRWISGIHHIRETIPFPRLINRLEP